MNRREFILGGSSAVGAMTLAGGCSTLAGGSGADGEGVRFLAFADIHYASSGFWPHRDWAWLDRVLARAVDAKCDFVMDVGDMTFGPRTQDECDYVRHYNAFKPVKTYHTYGNHEYEGVTPEKLAEVYEMPKNYYSYDCKGFRFIALDPHYRLVDGRYELFHKRCSYPGEKRQRSLGPVQLAWLRETVLGSPHPCVIFSHESFERIGDGVDESAEVRALFAEANAACPGKVRLCVNGHDHVDNFRILDGVTYLDLNSASYAIWSDHKGYPEDFRKQCGSARCILTWNDPISAVITMTPGGRLKIDGMKSSFYLGVTPEAVGWKKDAAGRAFTPDVQSVDLTMNY